MKRRPLPPVREEVSSTKTWRSVCRSEWAVYTLVASVGALSYVNSLNGEFVHDDIPAIVTNKDVIGVNPILRVFSNDFWGTPMSDVTSHKSYRPLTTLSFRLWIIIRYNLTMPHFKGMVSVLYILKLNHAICGLSPWWWHACNVVLHATCCTLVARTGAVVARLQRPFAALAGLLFAIHPIHTEAVAGVVGRADVLACFFYLSSILLYHGSHTDKRRVWSAVAPAALGMLAKETGVTVLLFNMTFDVYRCWACHNKSSASSPLRWRSAGLAARLSVTALGLAVLTAARVAALHGALPAFSPQDNPPAFHPSLAVRLMTFCYLAAFNWWLLLCPWTLSHDWQMGSVPLVTSAMDSRNLLTCAAFVALLTLTYRCVMDIELQRHTPAAVGLLLLVTPYLPASNLVVTVGFVVAERVLYIPSVGSVLLTSYGVQLLWRHSTGGGGRKALILSLLVIVASWAARTQLRNRDWRTKEALLRADLAVLPHNAKLHYNFGNFLKDIDEQENAITHYKEALRLWPGYASAHNNLGTLVVASGHAEHHFLQALKYNREHVNAHYNLGKLYRKRNHLTESLKMLQRCVTLEPRFIQAYLELLLLKPELEKRKILDKLLELEPNNWEHYILYGNWFKVKGLKINSLKYYLEAMRLAFRSRTSDRVSRGELVALRSSCRQLRDLGQTARMLQLITRWHVHRGGAAGSGGALVLRGWRLRTELSGRALLYSTRHKTTTTSTCLHHSQLEISEESYTSTARDSGPKLSTHQRVSHRQVDSGPLWNNNVDKIINHSLKISSNYCQTFKHNICSKKSVSLSALYKPTHNKSEIGHKHKSSSLHKTKDDKVKQVNDLTQLMKNNLIETF